MREILKWRVPVTDSVHGIKLPAMCRIIHVGAQTPYAVEFWTESLYGEPQTQERRFIVHPTGEPFPGEDQIHVGTALVGSVQLVWHLYEVIDHTAEARELAAAGASAGPDF